MGAAKPALRGTQIVGKAVVRSDLMILIIIGSDLVQSDLIVESDWLIGSGLYHHRIRLDRRIRLALIGSGLITIGSDLIVEIRLAHRIRLDHHRIRLDHNWIRLGSSSDQI